MLLKMPRWPANVISSPSGPCTTLTPGVSVSRSSNFLPRIGVVSTVSWFSVFADAVRVDSTTLGDVVTVTVSATPDGFRTTGSVTDWPTVSCTFSCTTEAKPVSVIVTR